MSGVKLTQAQVRTLGRIARRDWPAGEPRMDWFGKPTIRVLLAGGFITERQGSAGAPFTWSKGIVDLTEAGRAALQIKDGGSNGGD